jgi:hypothetical protein
MGATAPKSEPYNGISRALILPEADDAVTSAHTQQGLSGISFCITPVSISGQNTG